MRTAHRNVILLCAAMVALIAGTSYIWSIFRNPLMELNGWTAGQVTLAYSLFLLFNWVGTFLYGPLQKKIRPSYLVLAAGIFQGFGFFLTGFANSVAALYASYSLMAGIGNGLLYNSAVSTATKWFPDTKGMANGLCIGCMGLAPLIFAPLGNALITRLGVLSAFKINGIITVSVILAVAWFIKSPEAGWQPEGWTPELKAANRTGMDLGTSDMLKTPTFWTVFAMTICSTCSGLIMTSQASALAQEMANATAAQASIQVALFAVGSFLGRVCFGSLSDKLGRFNTQIILLAVTAVDMLFFFGKANDFTSFMVVLIIIGACFGGTMSILPTICSDIFGSRSFGTNYAFVYFGYTVASFVGPTAATSVYEATGAYNQAFVIAGMVSIAGIILTLISKRSSEKLLERELANSANIPGSVSSHI